MMRFSVIGILVCVAAAPLAAADYTDSLWNTSGAREYYDCGDWSGVHNPKDLSVGSGHYWWSKHRKNGVYVFDPTNWGYPPDAYLERAGFSNIEWTCVHIFGFDKTLNYDGKVYTDNPKAINYKTSYLRVTRYSTLYWHIYRTESSMSHRDTGHSMTIKNTLTFYAKHTTATGKKKKKDKTYYPEDTLGYAMFPVPDTDITVQLINHSTYMILKVPTPAHVTGIRIHLESRNTTAEYEKQLYCLQLNKRNKFVTCDLVEYKYHNFIGMSPAGHEEFILRYEPDYMIDVTLYTPFEQIAANVTVQESEVAPVDPYNLILDPFFNVLYILLPVFLTIWLVRLL
ncbi:MAG: hypothetical protein DRI69_09790 [Bacteroidetes bacterium]|nr:MAG: hypothetical protein DRI69_09790 [Bacteroidota bacterium]